MNKSWIIYILLFIPGILFSQNFNKTGVAAFMDIKNENYSKAIDSLDKLISENPKSEFYLAKSEAYFKLGDLNAALEYCTKADKIKSFCSSDLRLKVYLKALDKENAIKTLNENLKSKYKISLFNLLNSIEYSEIYNLELDSYILSGNFYSQTEKQLYQAGRLIDKEKSSQALFVVDQILSMNNNIADAHYLKSVVFFDAKDFQGALQSVSNAIKIKKTNPNYYEQRATINTELKNYDEALADINKLIRLEPYEIENFINKANLLFEIEHFDEAIELLNSILEISHDNPDVLYLSGKSNYMKEDYFEALKAINQSLQIKTKKEYFELRGDIYTATYTFQYAVQDYSMYLDIEPFNGNIYAKKGLARFNLGDKKGACSDWKKGKRYGSYDAMNYLEKYCE